MEVFVTVPHGVCPSETVRRCDFRASSVARLLSDELLRVFRNTAVRIRVFYANSARELGDLNRRSMRNSVWRTSIQNAVIEALQAGKKVLLFDVHSFPNTRTSFSASLDTKTPQIVYLEHGFQGAEISLIPSKIRRETTVDFVRVLGASAINDITVQARKAGAEAQLWEFNESKTRLTDNQVTEVVRVLANYAVKQYEKITAHNNVKV